MYTPYTIRFKTCERGGFIAETVLLETKLDQNVKEHLQANILNQWGTIDDIMYKI